MLNLLQAPGEHWVESNTNGALQLLLTVTFLLLFLLVLLAGRFVHTSESEQLVLTGTWAMLAKSA